MTNETARETRYWQKVDKRSDAECWPWTASRNQFGYGTFRGGDGEQLAHRFGYRLFAGPIPSGMVVCHRCDNPPCQNPAHLFLGTQGDNIADMDAKGRRTRARLFGEMNPRVRFTEEQVRVMCAMYESGTTQAEIARRFGTRQSVVGKILHTRAGSTIDGSKRRAFGLRNTNGKLSDDEVAEIRRAYAAREASQAQIGKRFGVSQVTVSAIVRGKIHV